MTPILMYHSISSNAVDGFRPFAVSPERFEVHARYLHSEGYRTLTVSELVRLRRDSPADVPKKAVSLTFDDGFADFHANALPILKRYGLTATLYVVSGCVGGNGHWLADPQSHPILTWDQLTEIGGSGTEIGAHTVSHPALDTLPIERAAEEIVSSKRHLEDGLAMRIESFAYPYGYYSQTVRDLVVSAGYSSACAVRYAASHAADDPFALCRYGIWHDTDVTRLSALLAGNAPRLRNLYERTRSTVWARLRQALYRRRSLAGTRHA